MARLLIERDGGVRTITLNRPEKRHAIDSEMMAELLEAFTAEPQADERVTVLRSTGPVFSAGADLRERSGAVGEPSGIEDVFHAIEIYPLPVVAVVQGTAIAGGCELALHSDFVVASTNAVFGMSLTQIGLAPTFFLAKKILEVAGRVGAREVFFLGDPIPAQRMFDLGCISRIAAPDDLDDTAQQVIDRIAANAPLSLRATKQVLLQGMSYRDGINYDDVNAQVRDVFLSDDAQEGIAARLEKRAPNFQGK